MNIEEMIKHKRTGSPVEVRCEIHNCFHGITPCPHCENDRLRAELAVVFTMRLNGGRNVLIGFTQNMALIAAVVTPAICSIVLR